MTQTRIDWNNPQAKISKYFTVGEVTQGDLRRIPQVGSKIEREILEIVIELDKIREEWGAPVLVTSWYRPPQVNCAVGGLPIRSTFSVAPWISVRSIRLLLLVSKLGLISIKGWRAGGEKGPRWNY